MELPGRLTESDLTAYLQGRDLTPRVRSSKVEGYQEAAAVLAAIDNVDTLRSVSGDTGDAKESLEADLVETPARRLLGGRKMLRYEIRRKALERLGTRAAIQRALDANPGERTGAVQATFERYVRGESLPLEKQSVEQLEETLQAVLWLEHLDLPDLPRADDVRLHLARGIFIQPFGRLAGEHFAGRKRELDQLRAFVGILDPETFTGQVRAATSWLLNVKPKPALNVFGPGGIGKSALVMRFFLEHINQPLERRVPFAYLDFDSPFLNIRDPSTLAQEIFRQLALQFKSIGPSSRMTSPETAASALARMLATLSSTARQPFLLVLDTFEEVQYGGEANALPLWDMLNGLQAQWPFVRVLISGRVPVTSFRLAGQKPQPLELTGVDDEAALAILKQGGVQSSSLAAALIKQVGRVPLSLRLAAAVVAKQGASSRGVIDLETTSYLVFSVSDEVIQGQLYERILQHLHSAELEKLAHPGLVLRRITPDLILQVLREPCGLAITTISEAEELYNKLAAEVTLVSEEADNALHHRADVRRTMLKLLVDKEPGKAEDIRRRAVGYYEDRDEPGATADELYYRLMLGELPRHRELDFRRSDVRVSLSHSLSELPIAAQLFLSGFGYDVTPEVLERASKTQRETFTSTKIAELLPHGPSAVPAAARLLASEDYRGTNSPLYVDGMRVRFLEGHVDDVFALADEGLRYAVESQDYARVLDILCLKAWVLEEAGRLDELVVALPHLSRVAERVGRLLPRLQDLAQRFRVARFRKNEADAEAPVTSLAGPLAALKAQEFSQVAPLLKDVIAPTTRVNGAVVRNMAQLVVTARTRQDVSSRIVGFLRDWAPPDREENRGDVGAFTVIAGDLHSFFARCSDDSPALVDLAAVVDEILRSWPDRLPYLQPVVSEL
jgi:hypothetical protein